MIDFDNPKSFPEELSDWDSEFVKHIRAQVILNSNTEWWEVGRQLDDLHLHEYPMVQHYVEDNQDKEVVLLHITRVMDCEALKTEGLSVGGVGSVVEKRICNLLKDIGVDAPIADQILRGVHLYWKRDGHARTGSVHFMIDSHHVDQSDEAIEFAASIGGEILRRAIQDIETDLYRENPYKQLWILGVPVVVKFKCKIKDIDEVDRDSLIVEIAKYSIIKRIFNLPYEFEFTGKTNRGIPAKDILEIKEIDGFIERQERYEEYRDFY